LTNSYIIPKIEPPLIVMAGYSGDIFEYSPASTGYGSLDLPSQVDNTIQWAYDSGGSETFTGYTPNDSGRLVENPVDSNNSIPPDGPVYAEPIASFWWPNLIWDKFNVKEGIGGIYQRVSGAKMMVVQPGQEAQGMTNQYIVSISPAEYSDQTVGFGYYGDLPVDPQTFQLNGQTLINSGITNDDGTIQGFAVVQGASDQPIPLQLTNITGNSSTAWSVNSNYVVSLQIIDTNGDVYSSQSNNVFVGQPMNLTCELYPTNVTFMNCMISNVQWTIPGDAISNYIVAPDTSSAVLYTNFPTTNSNVQFYWVDGATNRIVQCAATINGMRITNEAAFTINRPMPQFFAQVVGSIAADANFDNYTFNSDGDIIGLGPYNTNNTYWLHFGIDSNWSNVGIKFIFTNAPILPVFNTSYGQYFLVQLMNSGDSKDNYFSGTNLVGEELTQYGLDTQYPFKNGNNPLEPGGYCPQTNGMWFDSPADTLDDTTWLSSTNSFTMYLMFQLNTLGSPAANNLPVPMYSVTWSWSGVAETNNSSGGYSLISSMPPSPSVSPTLTFPVWNTNVVNFKTVHNLAPFNEN
jgi:hypothetical protein